MKLKTFLMIVICTGIGLPSVVLSKHRSVNSRRHVGNPKKINEKGEYLPYYGYTIAAMIDNGMEETSKQIEEFIQTSSLKKSYSALPASSYHTNIYSIYSCGDHLIPPVERWISNADRTIPNRGWLPAEALDEQNNMALCILERYMNETLHIKYASLNIGKRTISLSLEVEKESLETIRNVRKLLAKVYEHADSSMEPIDERMQITLAYVYGEKKTVDVEEWNKLSRLARPFNGAKLSIPIVYLFESMKQYYPFQKKTSCNAYSWQ